MNKRFRLFGAIIIFWAGVSLLIFYIVSQPKNLKVFYLNIGQGDSAYVRSPDGTDMIIDGGPSNIVLSELGAVMPWYDKKIDVMVITNPDKDHIAGLIDVLDRFEVKVVIEPGTTNDTATYKTLEQKIKEEGATHLLAYEGLDIKLGEEANFEFLFPDRDVSMWERNDGSAVGILNYGETSFLFMGDSTILTEALILEKNSEKISNVNVLKAGHHGSKTSTGSAFLEVVSPDFVIISAGENNSYGHPSPETIERINEVGSAILTTYEGRVEIESDGNNIFIK